MSTQNPADATIAEAKALLKQLAKIPPDRSAATTLAASLKVALELVEKKQFRVIFLGSPGVGKSALLSHLLGLTVPRPQVDGTFGDEAVLLTGSGRATACPLTIQGSPSTTIRLRASAVPPSEMTHRYRSLVADLLRKPNPDGANVEGTGARLKEEERRVLLTLARLNKQRGEKNKWEDPVEPLLAQFRDNPEGLLAELLRRSAHNDPTRPVPFSWSFPGVDGSEAPLVQLRETMERVSLGRGTFLPGSMTIELARGTRSRVGLPGLRFVDLPGIEEPLIGRADILDELNRPESIFIICMSLKDTPGTKAPSVLDFVKSYRPFLEHGNPADAQRRILLVILDHGEARMVPGADRIREQGQSLKQDECRRKLEELGHTDMLGEDRPLVIDAGQEDDLNRLRVAIRSTVDNLKDGRLAELSSLIESVKAYLKQEKRSLQDELTARIEEASRTARVQHWPEGGPARDPMEGVYSAIEETHAGTVNVACYLHGLGQKLDVYTVLFESLRKRAWQWLTPAIHAEVASVEQTIRDPQYAAVAKECGWSKQQTWNQYWDWATKYAKAVQRQIKANLIEDPVWGRCEAEWGTGVREPKYRARVVTHLRQWSLHHGGVPALFETSSDHTQPRRPATHLCEVQLRYFRGIADLTVPLHRDLTVIIGSNGIGKTTVLSAVSAWLAWLAGILGGPNAEDPFRSVDIYSVEGADRKRIPQGPLHLQFKGTTLGVDFSNAAISRHHNRGTKLEAPRDVENAVREVSEAISKEGQEPGVSPRVLPVLACYGEQAMQGGQPSNEKIDRTRQSGYTGALSANRSFADFTQWFAAWDQTARKSKAESLADSAESIVEGVRGAVDIALRNEGWQGLEWDLVLGEPTMRHPTKGTVALSLLSNGLRRVVTIVADLAHRCVRLNPHLGVRASLQTPGVVLIDEVDLHMHPSWQMRIIPSLREAFPEVQFILTTHSPVVVASCLPEQVRILREIDGEPGHLVAEVPQEDPRMLTAAELLMDFFRFTSVTPNPFGYDLREATALAASDDRNAFEELRLQSLLHSLHEAGVDTKEIEVRRKASAAQYLGAGANGEEA